MIMPKIRVRVDEDLCIGAASCVTIAPETFQLNEDNKAWVLDHGEEPGGSTYERWLEVTEDEKENILLGAQSCPTLAIFIYEEDGTQIFPEM
ncbi:ferredoxin [Candidatus Uhrbacteria bacterium CG_4_9_14_3_um_filter_50_9]|uniref:Ferredoxin n=1 Tax=Candidatus Uhrbacteria bacterium CG_4_9_14_3_um_filter_50_9 TaxID=1975035 RepID=A0A2M7XCN2_9BACT|nr:MAG: ferredoxin [Candidatus Uhrbacteria bacterium CG_4_9_14_3_um_filter_50_9]